MRKQAQYKAIQKTPVESEKIYSVIDCARRSPSAKNRQPWYFRLLTADEKNAVAKMMAESSDEKAGSTVSAFAKIVRDAPTAFLVCTENECCTSDYISIGCALEAASLKATDLGLGSLIVVKLGVAVFRDCRQLKSVKLPLKTEYLHEAFFRGCRNLQNVYNTEYVTELGEAAFLSCASIEVINLPSLKKMTEGGFRNCPSLKKVNMPETVEGPIDTSFEDGKMLEETVAGGFVFEKGAGKPI